MELNMQNVCVTVGILHVLHDIQWRDQPLWPSPHRQCVHLQTRQAPGTVEVLLLHGAACWVNTQHIPLCR